VVLFVFIIHTTTCEQHNVELHNFYSSPSIIRTIKSRSMKGAWHVAHMGKKGLHIGHRWECHKEKAHYKDIDIG
jgi:hypothetical protein